MSSRRKAMTFEQRLVLTCTALSVPAAYLGNRAGGAAASAPDLFTAILDLPGRTASSLATAPLAVDMSGIALMCALLGLVVPWCFGMGILMHRQRATRQGEEHGSARFADPGELVGFVDEKNADPERNKLILTEHVGLALSRDGYSMQYDRNLNVIVIGGSGTGKTRYYVKPNVAQANCDLIITDPKGDLLGDTGQGLVDEGYEVSSFNTFMPDRSLVYNPLEYVRTDLEIQSFCEMLVNMRKKDPKVKGDPFWDESAKILFTALIAFLRDYMGRDDYTIAGLLRLFAMAKVMEDREDYESPLDKAFLQIETGYISKPAPQAASAGPRAIAAEGFVRVPSKLRRRDGVRPYHHVKPDGSRGLSPTEDFALENYKAFKQAAGKTLKSILITCNSVLRPFYAAEVKDIVSGRDEMHLDRFGDPDRKQALFLIFKDTDQATLGFLHGMIVYQTINALCQKALDVYGGRLPRCVNFLLDEYRSLSLPEDISAMISVIRSRNIAMSILLQGISQLGELYDEKAAASIMACCDTILFLGSNQPETTKYISELCGQQTVLDYNVTASHGGSGGWSKAASKIQRQLMTPDEVARLDADKAIVAIRGADPCVDTKFPLENHPRAALVNAAVKFDIRRHMTRPPGPAPAVKAKRPARRATQARKGSTQ